MRGGPTVSSPKPSNQSAKGQKCAVESADETDPQRCGDGLPRGLSSGWDVEEESQGRVRARDVDRGQGKGQGRNHGRADREVSSGVGSGARVRVRVRVEYKEIGWVEGRSVGRGYFEEGDIMGRQTLVVKDDLADERKLR